MVVWLGTGAAALTDQCGDLPRLVRLRRTAIERLAVCVGGPPYGALVDVADARDLAQVLLAESLPRRWRHVQAVAATAECYARSIRLDRRLLVCSAWLHDIGYALGDTGTGFHPIDGARYLRAVGWPGDICGLVAHHSCARVEAQKRGLGTALAAEFTDTPGPEQDALWAADASTGPDGQTLTLDERVTEVVDRYGEDNLVSACMRTIQPELLLAIDRTMSRAFAGVFSPH